jgi:hypothetical protein
VNLESLNNCQPTIYSEKTWPEFVFLLKKNNHCAVKYKRPIFSHLFVWSPDRQLICGSGFDPAELVAGQPRQLISRLEAAPTINAICSF